MSWNFVEDDQRKQIMALKEVLSVHESKYAALEDQLLKRNAEFSEIKQSHDETAQKLRSESDRAQKLESDLIRRSDEFQKESFARQNAETALHAMKEQMRAEAAESKELQTIVDRLAQGAEGSRLEQSELEEEKRKLTARVRELEVEVRRVEFTSPPPAPVKPVSRPRSSSLANLRVASLEQDLTQLRESSKKCHVELETIQERLGRAQSDMIRVENEKTVLERRLRGRERELLSELEEKEDEIKFLRTQVGSDEREQELQAKLEEEESKVVALQMQVFENRDLGELRRTLEKTQEELVREVSKRREGEEREADLAREKEEALRELHEVSERLSEALRHRNMRVAELEEKERNLCEQLDVASNAISDLHSQPLEARTHAASATLPQTEPSVCAMNEDVDEASLARMLAAIDRLRSERDVLRRDLDFMQTESRFTVEALQAKLMRENGRLSELQDQLSTLQAQLDDSRAECEARREQELSYSEDHFSQQTITQETVMRDDKHDMEKEVHRLRLAAAALLVSIDHVHTDNESLSRNLDIASATKTEQADIIVALRQQLSVMNNDSQDALTSAQSALASTEAQLADKIQSLEDVQAQLHALATSMDQLQGNIQSQTEESDRLSREKTEELTAKDNELAMYKERLSVTTATLEDAEAQRVTLKEEVATLQSQLVTVQEDLTEVTQRRSEVEENLSTTMSALKEAEAQRDHVKSLIATLESRLDAVHEELAESNKCCTRLQSAQLEGMSSNSTAQALQEQIVALEARVMRRTEQIGIHQHDIKRLETNMLLAEERLGELLSDLEMASTEKTAMLDDCAAAREERDRAKVTVQELENEVDALTQQVADKSTEMHELQSRYDDLRHSAEEGDVSHSIELAALVSVVVESCGRSRALLSLLHSIEGTAFADRGVLSLLGKGTNPIEMAKTKALLTLERGTRGSGITAEDLRQKAEALESANQDLEAARLEIQKSVSAFEVVQTKLNATSDSLQVSEQQRAQLADRIADLEADISIKAAETAALQQTLVDTRTEEEVTVAQLNGNIATLKDELELRSFESAQTIEGLEAQHRQINETLASTVKDLAEQRATCDALCQQLDASCSSQAEEMRELQDRLKHSVGQIEELQLSLEEEQASHQADRTTYESDLKSALAKYEGVADAESQLRREVKLCQEKLDQAHSAVEALEEQKAVLQGAFENMEAETRGMSVKNQILEKQIHSCEKQMGVLKDELTRVRTDLSQSQKSGASTEMNLVLLTSEHEKTTVSLRNVQRTLDELQEQNQEMERLLRSKCVEIEENDDKFIQLLKEKKKLSSKVETLTKKVQNLQSKLSAATASAIRSTATARAFPDESTSPESGTPESGTPGLPISHIPQTSKPESSAVPVSRPTSAESERTQGSTFKTVTPEAIRTPSTHMISEEASSSSSSGKKRPAPDDFDPSEPLPPQPIVAEGLVTPRPRRPIRSGFTPVRSQAINLRPTLSQPSPVRRVTSSAKPVIADVTNSPRRAANSQSKPQGRGWLGKIRGGASESSRAGVKQLGSEDQQARGRI